MSSIQEQLAAAAEVHFDTQYKLLSTLTNKAFEGMEQIIELNFNAAKTSEADTSAAAGKMTAAEYRRRLMEIGESVYSGFTKAAEEQIADSHRKLVELVAEAETNALPGSENAITVMKTMLSNAHTSYEQIMNSTRQATETLRNNATASAWQMSGGAQAVQPGGQ